MAFFKFPLPGQKRGKDKTPAVLRAESIEAMRRRAKHRLIGAAVLVLVGVVGFPLVFDTQPRPIAVNIPIEIPDQNQVKPLVIPAQPLAAPAASASSASPAPAVAATPDAAQVPTPASLGSREELVTEAPVRKDAPQNKPENAKTTAVAKAESKQAKPAPRPDSRAAAQAGDAARAEALLDGKSTSPPVASQSGRFVVQVGAFADGDKAREARQKLEKAGLKTYTQVVETKDGKRTRVRVGPFGNRAEADQAAGKIKGLALPAAVLTL